MFDANNRVFNVSTGCFQWFLYCYCPGLCGIDEMVVGDIFSGYNELYQTLISKNVWERCVSCRYFPVCLGGCKAQAYMKYNTCLRCYCRKSYYDKVVPEYIKIKFFFERDD